MQHPQVIEAYREALKIRLHDGVKRLKNMRALAGDESSSPERLFTLERDVQRTKDKLDKLEVAHAILDWVLSDDTKVPDF